MAASDEGTETVEYRSAKRQRNRELAIKRDQYRCQYCRRRDDGYIDLHVHHIRPVSNGGTHDLDNLVTLCNNCHNRVHHGQFDDREELPPEIIDELNSAYFLYPDTRWEPPASGKRILEVLRERGPTKLSKIADQIDEYADSTIRTQVQHLKESRWITRRSRGVYGYISTLEYRELEHREADENGLIRVHLWDPGEQSELTDFVADPRAED